MVWHVEKSHYSVLYVNMYLKSPYIILFLYWKSVFKYFIVSQEILRVQMESKMECFAFEYHCIVT